MVEERWSNRPDPCQALDLPADLLFGCVETGGRLTCEEGRLEFVPGEGEPVQVAFEEIVQMRLGGRMGADANRIDLKLADGHTLTLLVLGRERVADLILSHRGWDLQDIEPGSGSETAPGVEPKSSTEPCPIKDVA